MLDYGEGEFEHAILDHLDFDGVGEVGGFLGVDFLECFEEFSADVYPFGAVEVIVLEEY